MQVFRHTRSLTVAMFCVVLGFDAIFADEPVGTDSFDQTIRPFLNQYCTKCHGAKQQKGERRFDRLPTKISDDNSLVDYQDILDQLNLGEMPPDDAKQPSNQEKRRVIAWLTGHLNSYHARNRGSGQGTVLRRLNSREYRNTIRDLLKLDTTIYDPTEAFPRDQLDEHLDNVGSSLVTSGHLLDRYLEAADTAINKAIYPLEQPQVNTWTFKDGFRQQPEIDQVHKSSNRFEHMTLYDVIGADKHEGAYGPILDFKQGVPHDGIYEITFQAEALHRIHPYDPDFLGMDPDEPFRLGIRPGNHLVGPLHKPQPIEPLLAEVELADGQQAYTLRVHLDRGYTPRFTFQNGLMDVRNLWSKVIRKYPDLFPKLKKGGIVENRRVAITHGKLPQIRIDDITVTGPLLKAWPTASQRVVFGDGAEQILKSGTMTREQMRAGLRTFATRAYRRPTTPADIDRLMRLIDVRRQAGVGDLEAYADALKAVLCSPSFLYLDEQTDDAGRLTPHALATRLAYFLWSSMPDERLIALADRGTLGDTAVLNAEVDRMLSDRRSEALVNDFLDSWLTLRDLGSTPPDRKDFGAYYHYDLGTAMREETRLFTRYLLDEDKSVTHFLDADFTFVNKPLARMYGIREPKGSGFERVSLEDGRRGGLLGQASILTVTANGIETSPVVRGVWLLENILGTPPTPPPPDVEPLDPDVRGATTIREQLMKHRNNVACNDCHRRIDPLGFALENYDPIGRWRVNYDKQQPVDASGELPGGKAFQNVIGLKSILVDQRELFTRALTNRMLAYATGRHIEPSDRPQVDAIIQQLEADGNGLKRLVELVVLSRPFRSP